MPKEEKKAKKVETAAPATKAAKKAPAAAAAVTYNLASGERNNYATLSGNVEVTGNHLSIDIKRPRSSKTDRVIVPLSHVLAHVAGEAGYIVTDHASLVTPAFEGVVTDLRYSNDGSTATATDSNGNQITFNTARLSLGGGVAE